MFVPPVDPDPVLGEPIANYPSNRARVIILVAVLGWTPAIILNFTLAAIPEWWGPALTVAIMATWGLALGWYLLHVWNREIILYEHGFTYREGSNDIPFFYSEVSGVRLRAERLAYFGGRIRRTLYRFTVTTTQEEKFVITDSYRRVAELGTKLTECLNRTLQPIITARLERGEAVSFSDTLTLSAAELRDGERSLSWTQYGGYRIGERRLALLDAAGTVWFSALLSDIDNITILIDLLNERKQQI